MQKKVLEHIHIQISEFLFTYLNLRISPAPLAPSLFGDGGSVAASGASYHMGRSVSHVP